MKADPSEIKLVSLQIIQSHFTYIPLKKKIKYADVQHLMNDYEIDIDFSHQVNKENIIRVYTKIEINNAEEPLPGYQLFIEGLADFTFTETDELSTVQKNNLKTFSTVNILIGYLRNNLASMTVSSPLGQYLLPPININNLIAKKAAQNL